jgi:hypothetical protein
MLRNVAFLFIALTLWMASVNSVAGRTVHKFKLTEYHENITVNGIDSGFFNEVILEGVTEADISYYPVFYDKQLQDVQQIRLYYRSGKRYTEVKDVTIRDQAVEGNFHSSKHLMLIQLKSEVQFKITYRITCHQLIYFSAIPFFSFYSIDTASYYVCIPNNLCFHYDLVHPDSLKYLQIDTIRSGGIYCFKIKTVPTIVLPDPLLALGIYKSRKIPIMRISIVPQTYIGKEAQYFSTWFGTHTLDLFALDSAAVNTLESITSGLTSDSDIMKACYRYIKTNFKYIDIEVGMGAFIPHNVNEILRDHQGDCKDLSALLCSMLRYKGINAYMALASTFDHLCDGNFPSLCSFDHMICVIDPCKHPVFLDPTDPLHIIGNPIESLQNRTIFIIDSEHAGFIKVPELELEQNRSNCRIELTLINKELIGNFHYTLEGFSGNSIRMMHYIYLPGEFDKKMIEYLKSQFNNHAVSNVKTAFTDKAVEICGDLLIRNLYYSEQNNGYLFLDFLPYLFDNYPRNAAILAERYLGSVINKQVEVQIDFNRPVSHIQFPEIVKTGNDFSYQTNNTVTSASRVIFSSHFTYNQIWIDNNHIESLNAIIDTYKKNSNEPAIVLF